MAFEKYQSHSLNHSERSVENWLRHNGKLRESDRILKFTSNDIKDWIELFDKKGDLVKLCSLKSKARLTGLKETFFTPYNDQLFGKDAKDLTLYTLVNQDSSEVRGYLVMSSFFTVPYAMENKRISTGKVSVFIQTT